MRVREIISMAAGFFVVFLIMTTVSAVSYAQGTCAGDQVFAAKTCPGDATSSDEQVLFQLLTKYRTANGRPVIQLSQSLSMVANRHLIDLMQNVKYFTHSWSNCPYDINNEKTSGCIIDAPQRLNSGYKGQGYETLYHTTNGNAAPEFALDAWKKSTLHNSIILNLGMFKGMAWDEVGIAVNGPYAALWFGAPDGKSQAVGNTKGNGLGVSYDQAVAGLSKTLSIDQKSSTVESNKWQGFSADRKIKLEIFGTRKDISEASLAISIKFEADGRLSQLNRTVLSTLLTNIFPEWPNFDTWITSTIAAIAADKTASRTKLVRKNAIEFRSDGSNLLKVSITPESKQRYVDVF